MALPERDPYIQWLRPMTAATVAIAALLLSLVNAHAAEYRLFSAPGKPVANYQTLLEQLQEDDFLVFSGGERYKIGKRLGCGSKTCVFALSDLPDLVLRIPTLEKEKYGEDVLYYVDSYIQGEEALKARGVPMVHVQASKPREFVVVDRIQSEVRLDEFLTHPFRFEESVRNQMTEELLAFARTTSGFASIGDFKADQVHYVKDRGWVLADWAHDHRMLPFHWGNTFSRVFKDFRKSRYSKPKIAQLLEEDSPTGEWLRSLQATINREIRGQRLSAPRNWCHRLYSRMAK